MSAVPESETLVVDMERMLLASFPALEADERDGVVVGRAHGVTGRANSAVVVGPVADVTGTLAWANEWLLSRSCRPLFRLSPLAPDPLVEALGDGGYNVTSCLHRDLRGLASLRADHEIHITATRPDDWISERAVEGQSEVAALMENVAGDVAWALVRVDGTPVGAGRGVLVDGWLCVQAMFTEPNARGRGLATAVLNELHAWAVARGATDAFLNVLATNDAAKSIYHAHGYEHVYDYRYIAST